MVRNQHYKDTLEMINYMRIKQDTTTRALGQIKLQRKLENILYQVKNLNSGMKVKQGQGKTYSLKYLYKKIKRYKINVVVCCSLKLKKVEHIVSDEKESKNNIYKMLKISYKKEIRQIKNSIN